MLKNQLSKFVNYFSSKSRIERQAKIIAYQNKKYNDYSDKELQLKIDELEVKEKNSSGLLSFVNIVLIAGVVGYIFKKFSLFILLSNHLKPQQINSPFEVQLGRLIDIGMGGIFILCC